MEFIEAYKKGQRGVNLGLSIGEPLKKLNRELGGLTQNMFLGIVGEPKAGKSTLSDYILLEALQDARGKDIEFEVLYFSFEIDKISKMFDWACYFIHQRFGIKHMYLPKGVTYKGYERVFLSSRLLKGRLRDDNDELIKVLPNLQSALEIVYKEDLEPLFDAEKPIITFIDNRKTPKEIGEELVKFSKSRGVFSQDKEGNYQYTRNDESSFVLVMLDHIRKVKEDDGKGLKKTVDDTCQLITEFRNLLGYCFVSMIHLNRVLSSYESKRFMGDRLYPSPDTIKDTGNFYEEVTHLMAIFDPLDLKYMLTTHFGLKIRNDKGDPLYPKMRTIHLIANRDGEAPQHFRVNMEGGLKTFEELIELPPESEFNLSNIKLL